MATILCRPRCGNIFSVNDPRGEVARKALPWRQRIDFWRGPWYQGMDCRQINTTIPSNIQRGVVITRSIISKILTTVANDSLFRLTATKESKLVLLAPCVGNPPATGRRLMGSPHKGLVMQMPLPCNASYVGTGDNDTRLYNSNATSTLTQRMWLFLLISCFILFYL